MTKGSNFWVIGGEFGSMNFHKLVEGSAQVQGPFKTRKEAEDAWRVVSEENRHKAGVRFSIVEEPARVIGLTGRRRLTLEETSKDNSGPIRRRVGPFALWKARAFLPSPSPACGGGPGWGLSPRIRTRG